MRTQCQIKKASFDNYSQTFSGNNSGRQRENFFITGRAAIKNNEILKSWR